MGAGDSVLERLLRWGLCLDSLTDVLGFLRLHVVDCGLLKVRKHLVMNAVVLNVDLSVLVNFAPRSTCLSSSWMHVVLAARARDYHPRRRCRGELESPTSVSPLPQPPELGPTGLHPHRGPRR